MVGHGHEQTAAAPFPGARTARATTLDLGRAGYWFAGAAFPFLLVLYLALSGGGYDGVVRGEVGIVVWWFLLLGAAAGALPISGRNLGAVGWVALGLLGAFTVWTALGLLWTESAERTVFELGRVASLLGILALAVCVQGREGLRYMVGGIAAAVAIVGAIALLSRIEPSWLPQSSTAEFLPGVANRLNYPLGYWNGLAALMAIGIPLLLTQALLARHLVGRALAAGAVPVLALTAFLTLSRGGAVAVLVGLAALLALSPRRLALLPLYGLTGAGSAILIAAANQREGFIDALSTVQARAQGDEMLAMAVVVGLGVALLAAALALALEHGILRGPQVPRRFALASALFAVGLAIAMFLVVGGPGSVSDEWQEFKTPTAEGSSAGSTVDRFASASGSNRYQFWTAALDANATAPLTGIGPGTYEYFWAEHGSEAAFVRDAHSLYLETLAELGIGGLVLLAAALLVPLAVAIQLSRSGSLARRRLAAGAAAAMVAFLVAAAIDWAWELTVLPAIYLLLAGAAIAMRDREGRDRRSSGANGAQRLIFAFAAIAALAAIAVPLASLKSVRASQEAARTNDLATAMTRATEAKELLPSMATPHLQQALVLEAAGELGPAADAAAEAAEREPNNWRTWLTLSRIEAERGRTGPALEAFGTAESLNPRSVLFEGSTSATAGAAENADE